MVENSSEPMAMFCDNQAATKIASNSMFHEHKACESDEWKGLYTIYSEPMACFMSTRSDNQPMACFMNARSEDLFSPKP